jgi:Family of unknown function (DUF5522)
MTMADQLAPRSLLDPHPSRLAHDDAHRREVLVTHEEAVLTGAAGYADPVSGLFVFTAAYLAARETCCASGCRHCPYVE